MAPEPDDTDAQMANSKSKFDFSLDRAKAFRQRDLRERERTLEENEKLYYDMKKFNELLTVGTQPAVAEKKDDNSKHQSSIKLEKVKLAK